MDPGADRPKPGRRLPTEAVAVDRIAGGSPRCLRACLQLVLPGPVLMMLGEQAISVLNLSPVQRFPTAVNYASDLAALQTQLPRSTV